MNKKAIVEIQFNWLYVAIVGFIILLVFFNIANGIRKNSQFQMEYELTKYFDNLLAGVQGIENSEHNITLSGLDLNLDVAKTGNDQCNYYSLGNTGVKQDIKYMPVFSPDLIKKQLFTHTLAWDTPFRASYFVYLTSSQIAYVVDDTKILSYLPNNIVKKPLTNFRNQNYYKIKYVFTSNPPNIDSSVAKLKDKDVTAIKVIPTDSNKILDGGKIEFYQKQGNSFVLKGTSNYFDKETMLATIYADNIDSYECNLKKAITRLNKITKLLIERAQKLKNADILQNCNKNDYQTAINLLTDLEKMTSDGEISENNFVSIKNQIKDLNSNLNKKSCPTIY